MQTARMLDESFTSDAAWADSFEQIAEHGDFQGNVEPLFASFQRDEMHALDAVENVVNRPLENSRSGSATI